jgi:hypothetical protein
LSQRNSALSGELVVPGYRFEPLIGTNWIAEQPDSWMRRFARVNSDLSIASFVSHPEREPVTGKLLVLRAPESTVFIVDCQLGDGHIVNCELLEATVLQAK